MKTTRDTLIEAVYQYLADHTIPTKKGDVVSFLLVKKPEFKRRVLAREKGFKRVNQEDIVKDPMKVRESLPYVKHAKRTVEKLKKNQWKSTAMYQIRNSKKYSDRLVVWIFDLCNKYIKSRYEQNNK